MIHSDLLRLVLKLIGRLTHESPPYMSSQTVIAMLSCLLHGSDSPRGDLSLTLHIEARCSSTEFLRFTWLTSTLCGVSTTLLRHARAQVGPGCLFRL